MRPLRGAPVNLTPAQNSRLLILEQDDEVKVVGHFSGCPVLSHYGTKAEKRKSQGQRRLSYLSPGGRLRCLGEQQQEEAVLR